VSIPGIASSLDAVLGYYVSHHLIITHLNGTDETEDFMGVRAKIVQPELCHGITKMWKKGRFFSSFAKEYIVNF